MPAVTIIAEIGLVSSFVSSVWRANAVIRAERSGKAHQVLYPATLEGFLRLIVAEHGTSDNGVEEACLGASGRGRNGGDLARWQAEHGARDAALAAEDQRWSPAVIRPSFYSCIDVGAGRKTW
jgi:hypothetical protein